MYFAFPGCGNLVIYHSQPSLSVRACVSCMDSSVSAHSQQHTSASASHNKTSLSAQAACSPGASVGSLVASGHVFGVKASK